MKVSQVLMERKVKKEKWSVQSMLLSISTAV